MGNVLKRNRYRLVDNHSFELPLPMKYELYKEDSPVAEYEISADQKVSFRIITKYKEEMLTPINRPLSISDIYFFLSSRVFQDNTPFTRFALSSVGLEKYNVMDIVRKTRGMTPYDSYWVKFEGDNCSYDEALEHFKDLFTANAPVFTPASAPAPAPQPQPVKTPAASIADTEEILSQHKPDVSAIKEELGVPPAEAAPEIEEEPLRNNTMTADEIEALLAQSGLTDSPSIDHFDFDDDEPASDSKMSQDDIEKLLAAQMSAAEPAPEPKPDNGGKMSQDDIEKLIAAQMGAAEPAPEPKSDNGGKMSQDDIEKLIAAQMGAAEPAPEPKPESGGKMSQDDIEKLLAAQMSAAEPAPEPKSDNGGKMSQDDIEKLIAAQMGAAEPAPEPKPESGGKMSQDDIEKLIAAQMGAAEPAPEPKAESGGKMSQDEIEALLSGMKQDASK